MSDPETLTLSHQVAKNPPRLGREYFIWADAPKGFGLRVPASADCAPAYVFNYRRSGGRSAIKGRLTLGKVGEVRFTEARKLAEKYRGAVLSGKDPREMRDGQKRDARTVDDLINAWATRGALLNRRTGQRRSQKSIDADLRQLRSHVSLVLGKKHLATLVRADIERLRDAIATGKTAQLKPTGKPRGLSRVRGGDGTATRTVRAFSSVCSWGVDQGWLNDNPVSGVRLVPERKCERFLTGREIQALGKALRQAVSERRLIPEYAAIIRMLALTGARKGEIEGLRWSEVDLERAIITKQQSKTGRKTIQLGSAALEMLRDLEQGRSSEWLFPNYNGKGHLKDTSRIFKILANEAGIEGVRLHDLRHTFASIGAASGLGLAIVGSILGHASASTTSRYAHLADDPLKHAAESIGSNIAQHLAAE